MSRSVAEVSIGIGDLIRFLLRGAIVAVPLAVLVGFAAYLVVDRQDAVYRADATLLVARSGSDFSQFGLSSVVAPAIDGSAYRAAAESDDALGRAVRILDLDAATDQDIRRLRGAVSVSVEEAGRDSTLLRVSAQGATADSAVARANAVARAMVEWDRGRASESLERAISTLQAQIEGLSEQIRSLQILDDDGQGTETSQQIDGLIRFRAEQQQQLAYARALVASAEGRLSLLQQAGTTPRRVAPRPALNAMIASVLAIILTYGGLLVRAALTRRLRGAGDIAALTGLPVLAQFPKKQRNEAKLREASSYLRTNLLSTTADANPKVFMVTSSHEGEGKSLIAAHLAESLVRNGHRTLLVDCDLRAPSVADRYPIPRQRAQNASTTEWLRDPVGSNAVVRTAIGGDLFLDLIVQYGVFEGASDMISKGLGPALDVWSERYDAIVFDTAPVRAVADALAIAPHCTATVLVVDARKTSPDSLVSTAEQLERVASGTVGVVVNRTEGGSSVPTYGYGYGARASAIR